MPDFVADLLLSGLFHFHVTTVFDGELDDTDVFVSLIAQKYSQRNDKEYLAKKQDLEYNKDKVQSDRVPSGLCG